MSNELFIDEKELLTCIAAGDEAAFRQIFHAHYNKLASFVQKLTKSHSTTEELVQDVFVKVWLNRSELASIAKFESWMYVIARNHVFNHLKKTAREYQQQQAWLELVGADNLEIAGQSDAVDMYSFIEKSIEKLPPQQKKIYLLKRQNGLRNEEIAQQLNISMETVKKHFTLALRFIKDHARHGIEVLVVFSLLF
ncbi:RNA polymerase sigma factor [Pinibacter aurantiacus]|uniref:RNA polymerase sigma-70 factor n=1 Tax=Pinibacter aurantiacus TaxID=2851599 RepID=A0A9E2W9U5_9BACT|nr:RNA polymerase sigma-70 factor [Pinibacter aurantiacus]MBV4360616.1 RNA polymerase sigma-70 factor [Pinibacter aurantiacus]